MRKADARMLIKSIAAAVKARFAPKAELRALAARVAALEAKQKAMPGIRYVGPWRDGTEYAKGDIVTFRGSMWYCRTASAQRPDESQSSSWQLCVKAGRDAR